ncbi:hypothetical protein TSUD_219090 [Trifolium subterraneum]|uniref:Uncharacterized protein n=1 Tax=Trifolium subterraneum TaxID=3900 RepID=A0A2Z6MY87_TRISU|nr:hypothetical protein TSUD_219090 [Trifolium subterraneum]
MAMGVDLAEAYVLRKMHKEKLKYEEEAKGPKTSTIIGSKTNRSSGCFFWFSKKPRRTTRMKDIKENEFTKGVSDPIYK